MTQSDPPPLHAALTHKPRIEPPPLYIVMTATARMPANTWGQYRHVALIKTDEETWPKMISTHARGVLEIVQRWDRCHVGKTVDKTSSRFQRSAYHLALATAHQRAEELNARERPLSTQARKRANG